MGRGAAVTAAVCSYRIPIVKWLGGMFVICALALLSVADAGVAATAALPMTEARSEARYEANNFTLRRDLSESNVGRCHRRSAGTVNCAAIAKGETKAATIVCHLDIRVRLIRHRFYASAAAAITAHHCVRTAKERLAYADALAAIQSTADSFAGTATTVTYMFRRDDLNYSATAKWDRPSVRPSEWEPTESCSVELVATLAVGKVSVTTEGFSCY